MKRDHLIPFALAVLLSAASAQFGLLWKLSERQADARERLARIEARLDLITARHVAKHP